MPRERTLIIEDGEEALDNLEKQGADLILSALGSLKKLQ